MYHTVYVLIYRTAKNNILEIVRVFGTDLYSTREMSGIIRTGMQLHAR